MSMYIRKYCIILMIVYVNPHKQITLLCSSSSRHDIVFVVGGLYRPIDQSKFLSFQCALADRAINLPDRISRVSFTYNRRLHAAYRPGCRISKCDCMMRDCSFCSQPIYDEFKLPFTRKPPTSYVRPI
jgi:hypothetical protein